MERAIPRYLRWHRSVGHSDRTVWFYETTLDFFRRCLADQGHSLKIEDLDIDAVRDWLAEMQAWSLSPATMASLVRALKAFTRWLAEEEWLATGTRSGSSRCPRWAIFRRRRCKWMR